MMARITPEGISHLGKCIAWANIERINIITHELAGDTTSVWVKSKGFTGTIHLSLQDADRDKALIAEHMAPERVGYDEFLPWELTYIRVRDGLGKFVWLALAITVAVYLIRSRPSVGSILRGAIDLAANLSWYPMLIFLLGVHELLFFKECWADIYRVERRRRLWHEPPARLALGGGIAATTLGAVALVLAIAADKWDGLVLGILGLAVLLAIKRYSPERFRSGLAILTMFLLFGCLLAFMLSRPRWHLFD